MGVNCAFIYRHNLYFYIDLFKSTSLLHVILKTVNLALFWLSVRIHNSQLIVRMNEYLSFSSFLKYKAVVWTCYSITAIIFCYTLLTWINMLNLKHSVRINFIFADTQLKYVKQMIRIDEKMMKGQVKTTHCGTEKYS